MEHSEVLHNIESTKNKILKADPNLEGRITIHWVIGKKEIIPYYKL